MEHLIEIRDLRKIYALGEEPVAALDGVSLTIEQGEFVAIMGASGSGKSTLLNILGCLDTPTSGSYLLDGIEVARRSRTELARIRKAYRVFRDGLMRFVKVQEDVMAFVRWHESARVAVHIYVNRSGQEQTVPFVPALEGYAFEHIEHGTITDGILHLEPFGYAVVIANKPRN